MKAIKYKIQTRKKWFQWFLTITYPLYKIKWQSISKIKHSIDTENDCMIASDTINCVCVCVCVWVLLVVLLFSCSVMSNSLVTPWALAHQVSLFMGFPRQEYWRGLLFPSPAGLSDLRIEPVSPALAGRFLTGEPPGKSYVFVLPCGLLYGTEWRSYTTKFYRKDQDSNII